MPSAMSRTEFAAHAVDVEGFPGNLQISAVEVEGFPGNLRISAVEVEGLSGDVRFSAREVEGFSGEVQISANEVDGFPGNLKTSAVEVEGFAGVAFFLPNEGLERVRGGNEGDASPFFFAIEGLGTREDGMRGQANGNISARLPQEIALEPKCLQM